MTPGASLFAQREEFIEQPQTTFQNISQPLCESVLLAPSKAPVTPSKQPLESAGTGTALQGDPDKEF